MVRNLSLEEIANEPNWFVFARKLRSAMSTFKSFNLCSENEVLLEVAALQGKDPASLQNPLAAERWVSEQAPSNWLNLETPPAMTNVLLLKQICAISPKVADRYYKNVFRSEISRADLKKVLEETKELLGTRGAVGHERWKRANEFSLLAEQYISQNLPRFTDRPDPELRYRSRCSRLPCDFEIWSQGAPVTAIEVKVSPQKSTRSSRAEVLGLASLLTKEFSEVIIVFSSGNDRSVSEVVQLRDDLNLTNVRIATLDERRVRSGEESAIEFL